MAEAHAEVQTKRKISSIWFIPGIALILGLWMVIYTIQSEGPSIDITFSTAEGIVAGETKLMHRNVQIGLVESASFGDDFQTVIVTAKIDKAASPLLREDTQFWVVRPRVGKGGVSGLGTLLSGGYIQVDPGAGPEGRREFEGLEDPPVTPAGTPGVRLVLTSESGTSVSSGDPILYEGHTVGRVESTDFDIDANETRYGVFVKAPFDSLVTSTTRFWNASGVSFRAGADGFEAEMGSIETLLIGGVAFGLPDVMSPGAPVEDGATFKLFPSRAQVNEQPYEYGLHYVVEFAQSVRGLQPGAPVQYRGITIGRVERVMLEELTGVGNLKGAGRPIPVLLRLEPGRMSQPDSPEGADALRQAVVGSVTAGMRASLETGSLVTGQMYIAMDIYPDAFPAAIGTFSDYPTIPTIVTGLSGLELKISRLLDKINELPIEGVMAETEKTLTGLDRLLNSDDTQQLPGSIDATLAELQSTLASLSADSELQERLAPTLSELDRTLSSLRLLLDTLGEQPNALIFNRDHGDDPRPPSGLE